MKVERKGKVEGSRFESWLRYLRFVFVSAKALLSIPFLFSFRRRSEVEKGTMIYKNATRSVCMYVA